MDIRKITDPNRNPAEVIADLKYKTVSVPAWEILEKEYDPRKHEVMNNKTYPDKIKKGNTEKVTRFTLALQKLAVKRMGGLMFTIPVKRIYTPDPDDKDQQAAAKIMESIFKKNRINSVNIERAKYYNAACEFVTIWYAQEQATIYDKYPSKLKLRCKTYSPMNGDALYPLFDEYDDLIALSVEYTRKEGAKTITYFDTYTAEEHIRWRIDSQIQEEMRQDFKLGKIPGLYQSRQEPIWEEQSTNVTDGEWQLSRNGNYIRKNSRPNWVIYSDNDINKGREPGANEADRNVLRYGQKDKAEYVTWSQAIESLKFQVDEIKRNFFMMLQLPDMSMDNMKATPMSGEARKMVFIDAQMKVGSEQGPWLETFDREVNVIKTFMKAMYPKLERAINELQVESEITAFRINDDKENVEVLTNATGGKAIMSQKTAIANLGYVDDIEEEMKQIAEESQVSLFDEPTGGGIE